MNKFLYRINIHDHLLMVLFFLWTAGSVRLQGNPYYLLTCISYTYIVFLSRKKKIGIEFWVLSIVWIVINLISAIINDIDNFSFILLFPRIGRIAMYYFIFKSIGVRFLNLFIRYVVILSIISMLFYIVDISFPGLFDSISSYLDFMTIDMNRQRHGWYIFVYMHHPAALTPGGFLRNSGFMWEPGGYSMILVLTLCLRFSINQAKIYTTDIFLFLCLISTFSTSGYLAIMFLMTFVLYIKGRRNIALIPLIIPALFFIVTAVMQLDFMGAKINSFIDEIENTAYSEERDEWRVNRISILKYSFEQSRVNPFGNGLYNIKYWDKKYKKQFSGSNTFANILRIWGYVGLFVFIKLTFVFFKTKFKNDKIGAFLLCLAYFSILFSNSMEFSPLIYLTVFMTIIYKNTNFLDFIEYGIKKNSTYS